MRGLRLLVLLLVLPGLVLPGGLFWRLCRCADSGVVPSCCAATCCGGEASVGSVTPLDGTGEPMASAHGECRCGVLATPEREPASAAGGDERTAPGPTALPAPATDARDLPACAQLPASCPTRAKPPPWATRTLPLLI